MLAERSKNKYVIQSVENALELLEVICEDGDDIRVSQLSERLELTKPNVFRLLATFEHRGYVEKNRDGHYRLGSSAYETAQKLLGRFVLLRKARPVMETLVWKCREAVYIGICKGDQILLLDMFDTLEQIKVKSLVGNRYPLYKVACGVVLLPSSEVATDAAVTRFEGYAADDGALGEGTSSLAVPLRAASGEICGSLCLVGPNYRFGSERVTKELLPLLRDAGDVISLNLGYAPGYMQVPVFVRGGEHRLV